jgi:phosphatidylglycerol:prolipoprotein diacylglycerol transferase
MYPVLFRIGGVDITSFGVLVACAALVGLLVFSREARRAGLSEKAFDAATGGVFGGLLGAKVLWTIEFSRTAPISELLFSRGGLSWFGGLVGGVGTGLLLLRHYRVPLVAALAAATPALALGHAIGRIGCFLVGDDYGRPTDLPWGVAFPHGLPPTDVPVHPTQLYETALLIPVALLLIRWRRSGVPDHVVLGRYLLIVSSIRFAIEFIRINLRLVGPFTLAQLISIGLALAGIIVLTRRGPSRGERVSAPPQRRESLRAANRQ